MDATVLFEQHPQAVTLTLNRPAKLNCLNWAMLGELDQALSRIESDPSVRLVVIRGAGERSFSTGGDLTEFRELNRQDTAQWIRNGQRLFDRLEALPAVTVAWIRGFAYGGGLELALACDLRLATPSARFAAPELGHGWAPGWGALQRLPRLIGVAQAKELILLGEVLPAERALAIGLVNRILEPDEGEQWIDTFGTRLATLDPAVLAFAKLRLSGFDSGPGLAAREADVQASLTCRPAGADPAPVAKPPDLER